MVRENLMKKTESLSTRGANQRTSLEERGQDPQGKREKRTLTRKGGAERKLSNT